MKTVGFLCFLTSFRLQHECQCLVGFVCRFHLAAGIGNGELCIRIAGSQNGLYVFNDCLDIVDICRNDCDRRADVRTGQILDAGRVGDEDRFIHVLDGNIIERLSTILNSPGREHSGKTEVFLPGFLFR